MKQKDTYDVGLDSLREAVRDFLRNGDYDGQQKQVTEELTAVAVAIICSMDRGIYEQVREETTFDNGKSTVKAKLSFSVELQDNLATATYTGNIKLKNDCAVKVDDGAQGKLELDWKGGKR